MNGARATSSLRSGPREVDFRVFCSQGPVAVDESIEVPFFRRLDKHFFARSDYTSQFLIFPCGFHSLGCDLCDDLLHRFDCVSASVEARGDNVRMGRHKFDGHAQTKRRLGGL